MPIVILVIVIAAVCLFILAFTFLREVDYLNAKCQWQDRYTNTCLDVLKTASTIHGHTFERTTRGVSFAGTPLNYESLAEMVTVDQEQRQMIVVAIDHVLLWELENPPPKAPTYFGHRLWLDH